MNRGRSHEGGRADNSRGPTNAGGAGGGGARGGDGELMSQGDEEDPEAMVEIWSCWVDGPRWSPGLRGWR